MTHNREWDRGKESWPDSSSWSAPDPRLNIRAREDEHQAEGKRRKFNNGVRIPLVLLSKPHPRFLSRLMHTTLCTVLKTPEMTSQDSCGKSTTKTMGTMTVLVPLGAVAALRSV